MATGPRGTVGHRQQATSGRDNRCRIQWEIIENFQINDKEYICPNKSYEVFILQLSDATRPSA
jgi:hypothetical protein